jgi:hypothetical protein
VNVKINILLEKYFLKTSELFLIEYVNNPNGKSQVICLNKNQVEKIENNNHAASAASASASATSAASASAAENKEWFYIGNNHEWVKVKNGNETKVKNGEADYLKNYVVVGSNNEWNIIGDGDEDV